MSEPSSLERLTAGVDAFAAANDALAALDAAKRIRAAAEALEIATVADARAAGTSWAKIGAVYGLTKQGAQQRFAKVRKKES